MARKQVHILIGGRVQSVGFRYFTRLKAKEFNIYGWVKNRIDGKVEVEASGEEEDLNLFIYWLKIGPPRAIVSSFSVSEFTPLRENTDFIIK